MSTSQADWPAHIENWRASGLSQADYCRQNDLKPHRNRSKTR